MIMMIMTIMMVILVQIQMLSDTTIQTLPQFRKKLTENQFADGKCDSCPHGESKVPQNTYA